MKMDFKKWLTEAHHEYNPSGGVDAFQPFNSGDTLTVYHGFNELKDAVKAISQGLTGSQKASRRYSYEAANNPKGLFVTLDKDTAKGFAGDNGVVIKFKTKLEDLEAPVWPEGTFGSQYTYVPTFSMGKEGKKEREDARKRLQASVAKDQYQEPHVLQSDDPWLALNLTAPHKEYQALFKGHLNPEQIEEIIVTENGKEKKVTPHEFLQNHEIPETTKIFKPNDDFNLGIFMQEAGMGKVTLKDLERIYNSIMKGPNKAFDFNQTFGYYLWPKQLKQAFFKFKQMFGQKDLEETYNPPFKWTPKSQSQTKDLRSEFPELQDFFINFSQPNIMATISMPKGKRVDSGKFEMTGEEIKDLLAKWNSDKKSNWQRQVPYIKKEYDRNGESPIHQEYRMKNKDYKPEALKSFYNDPNVDEKKFFVYTDAMKESNPFSQLD